MKKGKSVVQKSENDNELISDWEIKLAEIEGEKKQNANTDPDWSCRS